MSTGNPFQTTVSWNQPTCSSLLCQLLAKKARCKCRIVKWLSHQLFVFLGSSLPLKTIWLDTPELGQHEVYRVSHSQILYTTAVFSCRGQNTAHGPATWVSFHTLRLNSTFLKVCDCYKTSAQAWEDTHLKESFLDDFDSEADFEFSHMLAQTSCFSKSVESFLPCYG